MRIGVFGGSFDPVHYAHLRLAACCHKQQRLDRVWFVPAASAPQKQDREQTPGTVRAEMLDLAISDQDGFEVCRLELERGGVSYTAETLLEIQRRTPQAELFLLLGSDSLEDLPNWRQPAEICRLATPVVVRRAGCAELDFQPLGRFLSPERVEEIRQSQVTMEECDISSTRIRTRVAQGESIASLVPSPVADYIEQHGLYK
jgi:nicotinate-nucleotide adenylyltransferase